MKPLLCKAGKEEKIKRMWERSGGLAATCEICGHRGGSGHVPWVVDYWPIQGRREFIKRAYRCECEDHRPSPSELIGAVYVGE